MSEQMDFDGGKYTVVNDNGRLTALRNGEPWNRDITGDNLIYWMLVEAIRLKEERDALAEWKRQAEWIDEPFKAEALAEHGFTLPTPREFAKSILEQQRRRQQAEPANARLVEALENCVAFIEDAHILEAQWHWEPIKQAQDALTAAEAQQDGSKPEESIAWRLKPSIDPCGLVRYMTQQMFEQQTPGVQKWYEPYHCVNCRPAQTEPVRLTDKQVNGADRWLQEAPFWRVVKFARAIESAVLRANGYKVEG